MSHSKLLPVVLMAAAVLVVAGCAAPTPAPATAVAQAATAVQETKSQFALSGTQWQLESLMATAVIPGTSATVGFGVDRYTGFGGCDYYMGVYNTSGDTLRMQMPAKTTGGCVTEPRASEQQATFIQALINTTNYAVENGKLIMYTTGYQRMLTMVPLQEVPLEGTTWDLSHYYSRDFATWTPIIPGSTITAKFDGKNLTGNAGCNDYSVEYKLVENRLTLVGDMAVTGSTCTTPEGVMDQQRAYIAGLEKVAGIQKLPRTVLFLAADGQPGLAFHAHEKAGQ